MNIEKISKITLWVLMGLSIVVIALFFLAGFDTPWEEDPKKQAPACTDVLLIWTAILCVVTAITMLASFVMYIKENGFNKSYIYTWGLPIVTIAAGAAVGFMGKDEHLLINGKDWNVPNDIIMTDACIVSIAILGLLAVVAIIYSVIVNMKK